jgi:hypothetical protein
LYESKKASKGFSSVGDMAGESLAIPLLLNQRPADQGGDLVCSRVNYTMSGAASRISERHLIEDEKL